MELQGYAIVRKGSKPDTSIKPFDEIEKGHPLRIMEIASDGDMLVVSADATNIGMFKKEDIISYFRCNQIGEVICPPDLSEGGKMAYYFKCIGRKGGYNSIVRSLVISASLLKKTFNDSVLWQKQ